MSKARLVIALTFAGSGLAGCGGGNGNDVRTVTVAPAETSTRPTSTAAPGGDAILIETRITHAKRHAGQVLGRSSIGEAPFCRGGRTTGGSEGPTIKTTFHCPGGTLKVQYAPTQPSLVQGSAWEIVRGTGSFEGMRGGGSMVARFERGSPDTGGEIFTGTVSR